MSYGINVTYQVKAGCRQAFLDALFQEEIPEAVRGEAGCLQYDYYLSVSEADQVLLVEQWKDRDAQKVHMTQPHMSRLGEIKERYVENVSLVCYDIA